MRRWCLLTTATVAVLAVGSTNAAAQVVTTTLDVRVPVADDRAGTPQAPAPAPAPARPAPPARSPIVSGLRFVLGGAAGLAIHETGHVATGLLLDARPSVGAIRYGPIRFFAIRHAPVTRRREFVISSAGFWMQHAGSEWILTTRPRLRDESAPFAKGVLAFNLATSAVYSAAAFGRLGPGERDTRGMASSIGRDGVAEPWIGVLVLAPAMLDAYRYLEPDARWPVWASRGAKIAGVALTIWAGR